MKRPIEIIDDFYTEKELKTVFEESDKLEFYPTCQPYKCRDEYSSRFQAYPCWQAKFCDINGVPNSKENQAYINLEKKLKELLPNIQIRFVHTFFRKIYQEEIAKSVCYTGKGMVHVDTEEYGIAGVIYLDKGYSFNAGTNLYTRDNTGSQFEHDIQVGSVFNRCIIYDSSILHQALFDMNVKSRFIQPFFITAEDGNKFKKREEKYDINNCI